MTQSNLTIRFICTEDRRYKPLQVYDALLQCVRIRRNFSDYVVGFDLADQEDRYHTLLYFLNDFINITNYIKANNDLDLPYFFHAGETAWYKSSYENVFDAILLNTSRIGHGFALKDYPSLMSIVRHKGIGIEVCPISNQILEVVKDLRDHAAVVMLANGLPITLSPDDPVVYGYSGVSYDFYEAYMAWNLTLCGLKQLTQNSLMYSALPEADKQQKLDDLGFAWSSWIDSIVSHYSL